MPGISRASSAVAAGEKHVWGFSRASSAVAAGRLLGHGGKPKEIADFKENCLRGRRPETKKNLRARISSIETEIKNKSTKINQKESEIKSLRGRNFIGIKDEKVIREFYIKARSNIDQSIKSEKLALKERADDLTKQLDSAKRRESRTFGLIPI